MQLRAAALAEQRLDDGDEAADADAAAFADALLAPSSASAAAAGGSSMALHDSVDDADLEPTPRTAAADALAEELVSEATADAHARIARA